MNLCQYSTQSGLVKIVFAVVGFLGWWMGKDLTALIPFYFAIAGAQGVASKT